MKTLNFLKHGMNPARAYLSALSFIFFGLSGVSCFAGVIYEYREEGSSTVIGTMEIQSPPANASSAWNTAEKSDLISLFLDNAVFGLGSGNLFPSAATLGFSGLSSLDGARLDGGGIAIAFPTIFPPDPADPTIDQSLSIQFDVPTGGDFIGLATVSTFPDGRVVIGDLFISGDWVVQKAAAVSEPGTLPLLGVSLFGIGWIGYRRRLRSVNA